MLKEWSDFFLGSPTPVSKQSSRYAATSGSIQVYDSTFCYIHYLSGNGGSILFSTTSSESKLLIEETSILNSRASGEGGGIYFSNSGSCILSKLCGVNCSSTGSDNQFDSISVSNDASYQNDVNDSSITYTLNSAKQFTMQHFYGSITIASTNISSNNCKYCSAARLQSNNVQSVITGIISYSSFANNTATSQRCINLGYCNRESPLYQIKSCNFIKNKQQGSSFGMITNFGQTKIDDSCFIENSGGYLFYNDVSYSIVITNCSIDDTCTTYGTVSIKNKPKSSFMNENVHVFFDEYCHFVIANKKKRRDNCYSFKQNIYRRVFFVHNYSRTSLII